MPGLRVYRSWKRSAGRHAPASSAHAMAKEAELVGTTVGGRPTLLKASVSTSPPLALGGDWPSSLCATRRNSETARGSSPPTVAALWALRSTTVAQSEAASPTSRRCTDR